MSSRTAFVAQPASFFSFSSPPQLRHGKKSTRTIRAQRSCRVVTMTTEDPRKETSLETIQPENSQFSDAANFIVDVGDVDLVDSGENEYVDEGVNVVDLTGADFDMPTQKRKQVRRRTSAFMEEINQQPESKLTFDASGQPPIESDELTKYVRAAVKAADERKGKDIVAIRVAKLTYIASFVVIVTGNNTPQIRAIGNLIEEELEKTHQLVVRRRDGKANSGWMLLDYGDLLVNIFTPEQRRNYNLEGLWMDGEELDISDCIAGPEAQQEPEFDPTESIDNWLD